MKIQLNGKSVETGAGSLKALLETLPDLPEHYAVALNDEIIPKERLNDAELHEGDAVEVFSFMAGGAF